MKRSSKIGIGIAAALGSLGAVVLTGSVGAQSAAAPHWEYQGEEGPLHWGEIKDADNNYPYALCADGSAQTPINITKVKHRRFDDIKFNYQTGSAVAADNGHTVKLTPSTNDRTIQIGEKTYAFAQVHFHTPSEHEINGKKYPVEVHFVNQAADQSLAVVGVMITEGREDNPAWEGFIYGLEHNGATVNNINWAAMLPKDKHQKTYRYSGSLTTPPCSEGVAWNLFAKPVKLSRRQINAFINTYNGNDRPVMPLNGRTVYLDDNDK